MFMKDADFKRLIKESWEANNLIVSQPGEYIYIQGLYWMMLVDPETMTNKAYAALIEMTREIPGEVPFRAGKGQANQYEFDQTLHYKRICDMQRAYGTYSDEEKTQMAYINKTGTLLRVMNANGEYKFLQESVLNLINTGAIDREKESAPGDPKDACGFHMWNNYTMVFAVAPWQQSEDEEQEYLLRIGGAHE